jgi:hypothetical protein
MRFNDFEPFYICDELPVRGIEVAANARAAIHAGKKHGSGRFSIDDTVLTRWFMTDS